MSIKANIDNFRVNPGDYYLSVPDFPAKNAVQLSANKID